MTDSILSQIPGQYIADAIQTLSLPQTSPEEMKTETDVPVFGRVRFTMKRMVSKKGKSRTYFWSVTHAEKV